MGVNIFAPTNDTTDKAVDAIVELANHKATGRFDWCDKFQGPGGWTLNLSDALAFSDNEEPWWVLSGQTMIRVKGRRRFWQHLLRSSGCQHVIFLKARL